MILVQLHIDDPPPPQIKFDPLHARAERERALAAYNDLCNGASGSVYEHIPKREDDEPSPAELEDERIPVESPGDSPLTFTKKSRKHTRGA